MSAATTTTPARTTVRAADLKWAQTVLNSPNLSRSAGELYEALRTLVAFAEPIREDVNA